MSWALIGATLFKPSDKRVKEIEEFIVHGDEILNDYLQGRILIFPVYHTAAPLHGVVYKEIFSSEKLMKNICLMSHMRMYGVYPR